MLRNDTDFATFSDAEIVRYAFFDCYLTTFVQ
jgi:hypothetical protein